MKKTFLFGMIALLSASFIFMSCPQPVEEPDIYTVTFEVNGGSTVTSVQAAYNTKITAPTAPTKTNYDFGGWYKETGLNNAWVFDSDTVTADITLYAKWTEGFTDVTSSYQILTESSPNGVTVIAKQSKVDSKVYITLGGAVPNTYTTSGEEPSFDNTDWYLPSNTEGGGDDNYKDSVTGKFAAVYISGTAIFKADVVNKILAIKQTNDALSLYVDAWDVLTDAPTAPVFAGNYNLYVPETPSETDKAFKWRGYAANALTTTSNLSVLIWDDASPKTATFEIQSYSAVSNGSPTEDVNITIIVDYSDVTFNNTAVTHDE